jgi:hypothetical protein
MPTDDHRGARSSTPSPPLRCQRDPASGVYSRILPRCTIQSFPSMLDWASALMRVSIRSTRSRGVGLEGRRSTAMPA